VLAWGPDEELVGRSQHEVPDENEVFTSSDATATATAREAANRK
jgi:hypothetical protein